MALHLWENEKLMYTLKKTPFIWMTPVIFWIFLFVAFSVSSEHLTWGTGLFIFILSIWLIVEFVRRIRYAGYITDKRIVLHYGFFRHEQEIQFAQIRWVNVKRYKSIFWHQIVVNEIRGVGTLFDYVDNYDEFICAMYEINEGNAIPMSFVECDFWGL